MTTTSYTAQKRSSLSQRWFARLWSWIDASVDQAAATAKDVVYTDLPDRIVEIGPGRGSSFNRYRPGTRVVGFEPNQYMHDDLKAAAIEHGIQLDLRHVGAEQMDLSDASQDAVVSTFTLCSVEDPAAALAEIRRVLKPGGRFLFVEHIAAEPATRLAQVQTLLRRPWAALADQCNLTAVTDQLMNDAGFTRLDTEIEDLGPKLDPSRRTLYGVAVR